MHLFPECLPVKWGSRFRKTQGSTQWARIAKIICFVLYNYEENTMFSKRLYTIWL